MSSNSEEDSEKMETTDVDESSVEIEPPSRALDSKDDEIDEDRAPSPVDDEDSLTNFVKSECVRQEAARNDAGASEPGIPSSRLEGFFANAYAAISRMQTETKRINAGRERLEQMNKNPETGIWEEEMQREYIENWYSHGQF